MAISPQPNLPFDITPSVPSAAQVSDFIVDSLPDIDVESLSFTQFKTAVRSGTDLLLAAIFASNRGNDVVQVARYASMGSGHRWRVMIAVAAGQIFSRSAFRLCMPGGVGVELAHCASIILDDLPSMDDGQFRRGKPCPHLVFPRWAVDLAPVYMVLCAYRLGLENQLVSCETRVATANEIGAAGMAMIAGQALDITHTLAAPESRTMLDCYENKSGALYAAAAKAGAMSAGSSDKDAALLFRAGMCVGISYQFLDDVADATAAFAETGKLPGQDRSKPTAVHFYGIEGTRALGNQYREEALDILDQFGKRAGRLCEIARGASWAVA